VACGAAGSADPVAPHRPVSNLPDLAPPPCAPGCYFGRTMITILLPLDRGNARSPTQNRVLLTDDAPVVRATIASSIAPSLVRLVVTQKRYRLDAVTRLQHPLHLRAEAVCAAAGYRLALCRSRAWPTLASVREASPLKEPGGRRRRIVVW